MKKSDGFFVLAVSLAIILGVSSFQVSAKSKSQKAASLAGTTSGKGYDFSIYPVGEITEAEKTRLQGLTGTDPLKRGPAETPPTYSDSVLDAILQKDAEFVKFRDEYLALDLDKNPLLLESFIETYAGLVETKQVSSIRVIFFLSQLQLILPFRSIAFRIRPFIDKNETRIVNSLLLTIGQQLVLSQKNFAPNKHAKALAKYFTEPFTEQDVKASIHSASELQDFLFEKVYPALRGSSRQLSQLAEQISAAPAGQAALILDNRMLYSNGSFSDGIDRFKVVGKAEILSLLAAQESALSQISFSLAYNIDGIQIVAERMGKAIGFDGVAFDKLSGVTAEERNEVLDEVLKAYPNYLHRNQKYESALARSFVHLKRSAVYLKNSWLDLKSRPSGSAFSVFAPDLIRAYGYEKQVDAGVEKWIQTIESKKPVTLRSAVTGEPVTVSLRPFFLKETALSNLHELLPTEFVGGKKLAKEILVEGKTEKVEYRSFEKGSPANWNIAAYKRYFPEVKSAEDVRKAIRVVGSAWGGGPTFFPLGSMLQ
ncbi:MAG: hypothetical protein IPK04_07165 [Bdellovibrionales bacterium]|nr:hypothetical protein [Bdellovibrionales bacterium]